MLPVRSRDLRCFCTLNQWLVKQLYYTFSFTSDRPDDWDVQRTDEQNGKGERDFEARPGHEISDDYEREMSVINRVLAAAAKRKEDRQKSKGQRSTGPQVMALEFL